MASVGAASCVGTTAVTHSTSARTAVTGFASPAALAGCRSSPRRRPPCAGGCPCGMPVGSAPSPPLRRPPLRVAGRLRAVDPFARVDAAAGLGRRPLRSLAAVAPRACNHAMTSVRHRLCMSLCCCARLPSTDVGPSGLRARRGMASPGAVAFALRAARPRRSARTRVGTARPCLPAAPRPREPALRSE